MEVIIFIYIILFSLVLLSLAESNFVWRMSNSSILKFIYYFFLFHSNHFECVSEWQIIYWFLLAMFWFLGFIWPIVIPEIPQTTLWKYLENTWKMKMKYCKPIPQVCRKVRNAKRLSGLCIYKYLYMNIVFCTLLMLMMYLMLHCLASTVSTCLLGNYPWQPCFACGSVACL